MNVIKKIVLATDFSETSKQARDIALQLRDSLGAHLDVIHVYDPKAYHMPEPYYFMPGTEEWLTQHLDKLRKRGHSHLLEYASQLGNCTPHFLEGRPGKQIVAFAAENDSDLIIMGTHGHGFLNRVLMGSVADYVVRHSEAAVLTVKDTESPAE